MSKFFTLKDRTIHVVDTDPKTGVDTPTAARKFAEAGVKDAIKITPLDINSPVSEPEIPPLPKLRQLVPVSSSESKAIIATINTFFDTKTNRLSMHEGIAKADEVEVENSISYE